MELLCIKMAIKGKHLWGNNLTLNSSHLLDLFGGLD